MPLSFFCVCFQAFGAQDGVGWAGQPPPHPLPFKTPFPTHPCSKDTLDHGPGKCMQWVPKTGKHGQKKSCLLTDGGTYPLRSPCWCPLWPCPCPCPIADQALICESGDEQAGFGKVGSFTAVGIVLEVQDEHGLGAPQYWAVVGGLVGGQVVA